MLIGESNSMENKMRFEKEKKKMLMLIGVGVVLAILFLIYAFMTTNMNIHSFDIESLVIIIAIILYPLGIVYGWNSIVGLYKSIRKADRSKPDWNVGTMTVTMTIMNIVIAGAITICFGWILGAYNAVITLRKLKKNI
jgi:hypothetical protein